jgi:actin-related protein 6
VSSSDITLDLFSRGAVCRRNPTKNEIVQQYVLPDLTVNKHGHIRQPDDIPAESDQILLMNNERFSVPELIFRPDDIGLYFCPLLVF